MNFFNQFMQQNMQTISVSDKNLKKYLQIIQSLILDDTKYDKKPYLNTTQNEQYIRDLGSNISSAFTILGGGDPIFQLLGCDVLDITAVDTNELQKIVYTLKSASFRTLKCSEYEDFLICRDGMRFLSKEIFDYVKDGFLKEESLEKELWNILFHSVIYEDMKEYLFKGGVDATTIDVARTSLQFIKKRKLYEKIRNNLEKAQIQILVKDAIDVLLQNSDVYDYIDITNILLFKKQLLSSLEWQQLSKKLQTIYETRLNRNGIFVLDYMFGIEPEKNINKKESEIINIYDEIYKMLEANFSLSYDFVSAVPHVLPTDGNLDTVIYSRKL